jgi:hypothetical protein
MRLEFRKRNAAEFVSRIIPEAKPSGINLGLFPCPRVGTYVPLDTPLPKAG